MFVNYIIPSIPSSTLTKAFAVMGALVMARAAAEDYPCVPMKDIYNDGTKMCETMWNNAFEVVDDDDGYTMQFFSAKNPNDALSKRLYLMKDDGAAEKCYIKDFFHKSIAGPEPLAECSTYSDNACCKASTVRTKESLLSAYGSNYRWDRCGKLSDECERFFIYEACFYDCDLNSGYWRKFSEQGAPRPDYQRTTYDSRCNPRDPTAYSDIDPEVDGGRSPTGKTFVAENKALCNGGHNHWQLYKMPIQRSFCNKWHYACRNDLFCGNGDYFSCAKIPVKDSESKKTIFGRKAIAVTSMSVFIAIVAVVTIAAMVVRERSGKPVFLPVPQTDGSQVDEMEL